MRLLVQGPSTVGIDYGRTSGSFIEAFDFGSHIEEAFGAQEKASPGTFDPLCYSKVFIEHRVRASRTEIKVLASTFRVETQGNGNCLENCGFSGTIFADKKSNFRMQVDLF